VIGQAMTLVACTPAITARSGGGADHGKRVFRARDRRRNLRAGRKAQKPQQWRADLAAWSIGNRARWLVASSRGLPGAVDDGCGASSINSLDDETISHSSWCRLDRRLADAPRHSRPPRAFARPRRPAPRGKNRARHLAHAHVAQFFPETCLAGPRLATAKFAILHFTAVKKPRRDRTLAIVGTERRWSAHHRRPDRWGRRQSRWLRTADGFAIWAADSRVRACLFARALARSLLCTPPHFPAQWGDFFGREGRTFVILLGVQRIRGEMR
jgi:hypothetical protein